MHIQVILRKRVSILLIASLLASAALAASPVSPARSEAYSLFLPAQSYAAGTQPHAVAVADFNGDGKPDLAIANTTTDSLSVLINDGSGAFPSRAPYAAGLFPQSVTSGDFNRDGKLDLAAGNAGEATVSVLLNNGNGTFATQVKYAVGANPLSIITADFNKDGSLDLATADSSGKNVSVLLGNGNGTFQPKINTSVNPGPSSLASADFNHDGNLDLAVADSSSNIGVLLGNGDGTFHSRVDYAAGGATHAVTVGDFNHDGRPDLAAAITVSGEGSASVLLGSGDGAFAAYTAYSLSAGALSLVMGDFTRDGSADLVVVLDNAGSGNLSLLSGNGSGAFTAGGTYSATVASLQAAAGDFNQDGRLDLVTANPESNSASVLLSAAVDCGYGSFQSQTPMPVGALPRFVAVGDLNNDGYLDQVVANTENDNLGVLLNNRSGGFASQVIYPVYDAPATLAIGDFDNDGHPDLVAGNYSSNNIGVLFNNGSGGFSEPVTYAVGAGPYGVAVGDFNLDGRLDVASANYDASTLSVLMNNGSGTFAPQVVYTVGASTDAVTIEDVNKDGKPDLVVPNYGNNTLGVLINNGNGTFAAQVSYAAGVGPDYVAMGDFNRDGWPDIAAVNYNLGNSGTLSILLNNGSGVFTAQVQYPIGLGPYMVIADDFNSDGRLDLAVANRYSSSIGILQGNGDGTFQAQVSYAVGQEPRAVAAGDFNLDGKPDLTSLNSADNNLTILRNQKSSTGALEFHSLGSGAWESPATWQCRVPGADDTVTIDAGHTVTLNANAAIHTLAIDGALAVSGSPVLTIGGDWTTNGAFTPASGTVTFNGSGAQTLTGDIIFHNVVVGSGSTLTTADDVTLTGALTNNGWTSETKSISGAGLVSYGLGAVSVNVNTRGTLSSLRVNRRDANHPNDPVGQQTGRYWSLTPNTGASGFNVDLTLPTAFTPSANDQVCRYTGAAWDCARTSNTTSSITRGGVTAFSDWTVVRYYATTTAVTASQNPSVYGDAVTFTAAVSAGTGTPGGTVTFWDGSTELGSAALNGGGTAALSTSALAAGTHTITAAYAGAGMHLSSSGSLSGGQVVDQRVVTVTADEKIKMLGDPDPELTYRITGGSLVAGDSFTGALVRDPGEEVGAYAILQGTLALNSNYELHFTGAELLIAQAKMFLPMIVHN